MKLAISACLLGLPCRYDGKQVVILPHLQQQINSAETVYAFCPEFAAFNSSPRPPIRLKNMPKNSAEYRLEFHDGTDVPDALYRICRQTADSIARFSPDEIILKEGSPVCGTHKIDVAGQWEKGAGLLAALLSDRKLSPKNEDLK